MCRRRRRTVFDVPADTAQNYHVEGLPFGTRGGILIKHQFPGRRRLHVQGERRHRVLPGGAGRHQGRAARGHDRRRAREAVRLGQGDANTTGNGRATPRIPVKAGLHTVGVTFLATNDVPGTELNKPFQRTMNTPGWIPGFQFYPHVGQVSIEGPYNAKGAQRHGEPPQDLRVPAGKPTRGDEDGVRRQIISDAREARVPPPADSCGPEGVDGVLSGGPKRRRDLRRRHRNGAAAHPGGSGIRLPRRAGACRLGGRQELSRQRSGAGVAVVVLPLEQHSRRRADRSGQPGQAQGSGRARASRCGGCSRIRGRRR